MARTMGMWSVLLSLVVSVTGCANVSKSMSDSEWAPTYVMVFTVTDGGEFTKHHPSCSSNCTPVKYSPSVLFDDTVFKILDVTGSKQRQVMYSPQWQQPDLKTAQEWAGCVLKNLGDRKDKPEVTSAYLLQIRVPVAQGSTLAAASFDNNHCDWKLHRVR